MSIPADIQRGARVFRKTDHGFQKVEFIADYAPEFPAVKVRTLDKAQHEWLVKPSEILTVAEKQAQDEIDYAERFPDIIQAWKDGHKNRAYISTWLKTSRYKVGKVVTFALRHNLITK